MRTVKEIPDELLRVTATERAGLYVALEELEHSIQLRRSQDARSRMQNPIPEMQPMLWLDKLQPDKSNRYATEVIHDVLQQCPDEAVQPGTNELSFITDQDLRETLRTDISTMNSALSNGEYKAATVLGGSVIEALLLWGLSKKTSAEQQNFVSAALSAGLRQQPDQDLTKWVLHQFIEVCASGKLIRAETATVARVAKDFRNLIHPGRMQRLNQRCDRGTALTVVAAVEHVSTDFAQNPP